MNWAGHWEKPLNVFIPVGITPKSIKNPFKNIWVYAETFNIKIEVLQI